MCAVDFWFVALHVGCDCLQERICAGVCVSVCVCVKCDMWCYANDTRNDGFAVVLACGFVVARFECGRLNGVYISACRSRSCIHPIRRPQLNPLCTTSAPASAQCICVQNYPGVVMLICMCPVIYLRTNTRARSSIGCRSEHNFW